MSSDKSKGFDFKEMGDRFGKFAKDAGDKTNELAATAGKKSTEFAIKAKDKVIQTKDTAMNAMDVNGDGNVDIEDIIILSLRVPGIRINREEFLRRELHKNYSQKVIDDAVLINPAYAGIPVEEVDKIVDEVIKYERVCVSGISTALGVPGGVAIAATVPADITQYYGYMLRVAQKMLYLYGFPEINPDEHNASLDSETMNILILCLGVMYGAAGANNAIKAMAKALASGVEKQLMKKALTKGAIYPIVKSVSKWFGVKMTKEVFAGFFKKAIPVVGGVIGGGLTFVTFKPCCVKLKESLRDTLLSNPESKSDEEGTIIDAIANDIVEGDQITEDMLDEIMGSDEFELKDLVDADEMSF